MPFYFYTHGLIALFVLGVLGIGTIFWVWMLVDCAVNKRISDGRRLVWILIILFTHWLGALLYFLFGRSTQQKQKVAQPYAQSQMPHAGQAPYYPYQGGYQAAQPAPPPYRVAPQPPPVAYEQPPAHDYEQPQAMYPHEQNNE